MERGALERWLVPLVPSNRRLLASSTQAAFLEHEGSLVMQEQLILFILERVLMHRGVLKAGDLITLVVAAEVRQGRDTTRYLAPAISVRPTGSRRPSHRRSVQTMRQ